MSFPFSSVMAVYATFFVNPGAPASARRISTRPSLDERVLCSTSETKGREQPHSSAIRERIPGCSSSHALRCFRNFFLACSSWVSIVTC
jgi:hypothetical protein